MAQHKITAAWDRFKDWFSETPLGRIGGWLKEKLGSVGGALANVGVVALVGRKNYAALMDKEFDRQYAKEVSQGVNKLAKEKEQSGVETERDATEKDVKSQSLPKPEYEQMENDLVKEQEKFLNEQEPKNPLPPLQKEVKALKAFIKEQNNLGAEMDPNIKSKNYTWDKNGHLIGISAPAKHLTGAVSFKQFPELQSLDVSGNEISSLYVGENKKLKDLCCTMTGISSLNLSKNLDLKSLACNATKIETLDLRANYQLHDVQCECDYMKSLVMTPSQKANTHIIAKDNINIDLKDVSKNMQELQELHKKDSFYHTRDFQSGVEQFNKEQEERAMQSEQHDKEVEELLSGLTKGVEKTAKDASERAKETPERNSHADDIINEAKEKLQEMRNEKDRINQRTNAVSKLSPEQQKDNTIREMAENMDNSEISNMGAEQGAAKPTIGLENITDETPDDDLGAFIPDDQEESFQKVEQQSLDQCIEDAEQSLDKSDKTQKPIIQKDLSR